MKKLKIKIFKVLSKIVATCKIFLKKFEALLIMKIILEKWFLKNCRNKALFSSFICILFSFCIPSNFILNLRKYFINQNKNYVFMIKTDESFCDQILQSAAILHRIMISNFILFQLQSALLSILVCYSATYQRSRIYRILLNIDQVMVVPKISAMNKKSYFRSLLNHPTRHLHAQS